MRRRNLRLGVAAFFIGGGLVLPVTLSAHNINLEKAQEFARDYARQVRKESNGKYTHYSTDCYRLFEGHNHYVRCLIEYDDDAPKDKSSKLCRETIDVYLQAHNRGETFDYYIKHYSGRCGSKRLNGARPVG